MTDVDASENGKYYHLDKYSSPKQKHSQMVSSIFILILFLSFKENVFQLELQTDVLLIKIFPCYEYNKKKCFESRDFEFSHKKYSRNCFKLQIWKDH